MGLQDLIERTLTEQVTNKTLTQQQIQDLTREIAKQVESSPELQALPEHLLLDKVQPTIQVVLASNHGSITNAAQYVVQVLISQVIEDPQIIVPPEFRLPEFCPYPGLRAFTEHEQSVFYGRETELNQFESCYEKPLVAITGASGVGKSSFVQAGIIPKIRQLFGENVLILSFRATTNSDLLAEFASLLGSVAEKAVQEICNAIEKSNDAVFETLQALYSKSGQRIFVIIDQFEEIFVAEDIRLQRRCLLDNILYFASHSKPGSISIVLVSRKNFLEHADYTSRTPLVEAIEKTAVNLDTLNVENLRYAIEKPLSFFNSIHQQNLHFQIGLVDVIVAEFRSRTVSLPLVQYLLRLLWVDKHHLSHFSYAALGKLDRVLDRHATEIYRTFSDEQKPNVDSILLALVRSGLEGEHTRKRIRYDQTVFTSTDELIVHRLTSENSRIISEQIIDGNRYLELTHEVILREWSLLRSLIDANRERLKLREQLLVNADLWFASRTTILPQGNSGYLYQGALYQQARKYVTQQKDAYSIDKRIVECFQVSQRRRKRNFLFALSSVGVITAVVAVTIFSLQQRAVDERQRADVNATAQVVAQAQADLNATAQAIAEQQAQVNENAKATAVAQANTENQVNLAQELADSSRKLLSGSASSVDLSTLLAVESLRRNSNQQASEVLFDSLKLLPQLSSELVHPTSVHNIVLSPEGHWVATILSDTVWVWDATTMQKVADITHDAQVFSAVFDSTGQWLLTASADNTARVWETRTGKEIVQLRHKEATRMAVFSPDGKWIVSISGETLVKVWETTSWQEVADLNTDGQKVESVAFSPDSKQLAIAKTILWGGEPAILLLWDVGNWQKQREILIESGAGWIGFSPSGDKIIANTAFAGNAQFTQLAAIAKIHSDNSPIFVEGQLWRGERVVSNDGKLGLTIADRGNSAIVIDMLTGKTVIELKHDDIVNSASLSPDGTLAITASNDKSARIWDLTKGKEIVRMPHEASVSWAVFTNDGAKALTLTSCEAMNIGSPLLFQDCNDSTATTGNRVKIWNVTAGLMQMQLHSQAIPYPLFSSDGKLLITVDKNTVLLFDIVNKRTLQFTHDNEVESIAFSSDNRFVLTATKSPVKVSAWNVVDGSRGDLKLSENKNKAKFSPDRRWIIMDSCENSNFLCESEIWDLVAKQKVFKLEDAWLATFSADGTRLATATNEGLSFPYSIRIFDVVKGQEIAKLPEREYVDLLTLSADGTHVLVASRGLMNSGEAGLAQIWDISNQKVISSFTYRGQINSAAFSPDGKLAVTASSNRVASVWEVATGNELFQLAHDDEVKYASFSIDNNWLVTASVDGTARIWEISAGRNVLRLFHDNALYHASFSPDSKWVVTVSADDIARLFPWQTSDLIELACQHLSRNLKTEEWQLYLSEEPYHKTCDNIP